MSDASFRREPRGRTRVAVFLALLLLAGGAVAADAASLEFLPLDHPAYQDLDWLRTAGLVTDLNPSARPWSRVEIATAVLAASARSAPEHAPVLRRVQREFARELAALGADTPYRETSPVFSRGDEASEFRVDAGVSGTAAGDGWGKLQFQPGSRGFVHFEWFGHPNLYAASEVLAQRVEPDRIAGDTLIKDTNLLVDTEEAYVSLDTRSVDAVFGLTESRWGPGRTGTLMLSDAAPPHALLRFSASMADGLEFHALTAALSQSSGQYLSAHRLTWRPRSGLAIGISESARYDAPSPEWLYVVGLIPYTVVHKIQVRDADGPTPVETRNNVMMGMDVDWQFRHGWRCFGEFLLDDLATESDGMPNRMAGQIGVDHVRSVAGTPVAVLLEATKVLRYTYATFYDRNYVVDGDPLGYRSGPDTERLHGELRADPRPEWSAIVALDLIRRGRGFLGEFWSPETPEDPWGTLSLDGPVERTVACDAFLHWLPRDNVRLGAGVGYAWTRNAGGVAGAQDNHPLARVSGYWRF